MLNCKLFCFSFLHQSDDDDFEHFNNEDEFENFAKDKPSGSKLKSGEKLPDLQMTKVSVISCLVSVVMCLEC